MVKKGRCHLDLGKMIQIDNCVGNKITPTVSMKCEDNTIGSQYGLVIADKIKILIAQHVGPALAFSYTFLANSNTTTFSLPHLSTNGINSDNFTCSIQNRVNTTTY